MKILKESFMMSDAFIVEKSEDKIERKAMKISSCSFTRAY